MNSKGQNKNYKKMSGKIMHILDTKEINQQIKN